MGILSSKFTTCHRYHTFWHYDQLLILSRIHKQQEHTFEPAFQMFDLLNSKDVNTEEDARVNLEIISNHMHELVARENDLIYFYKQGAEILGIEDDGETEK